MKERHFHVTAVFFSNADFPLMGFANSLDKKCVQVLKTKLFVYFQIDWVQYVNYMFSMVNKTLLPETSIVVYAPEFLGNMTTLIKNYLSTPDGKM